MSVPATHRLQRARLKTNTDRCSIFARVTNKPISSTPCIPYLSETCSHNPFINNTHTHTQSRAHTSKSSDRNVGDARAVLRPVQFVELKTWAETAPTPQRDIRFLQKSVYRYLSGKLISRDVGLNWKMKRRLPVRSITVS